MIGFVLVSATPLVPFAALAAMVDPLTKHQARVGRWWQCEPLPVNAAESLGDVPKDPRLCLVIIEADIPEAPGDLAYHTVDEHGRPVCKIGWNAILANGGTLFGPDGLSETISHELGETRVNALVRWYAPLNATTWTALEICDWAQGTGYCEPGSPDVYVANFVGPHFFDPGAKGLPLDARNDFGEGQCKTPLTNLPGGYHEEVAGGPSGTSTPVFGAEVPAHVRERVQRQGVRGGMVRGARP